ncbi:hypothetical protein, partial [Dokdonella sp.]|uniref:hypothetical protein n=1 Tax=Dokdonella sp. TaxID=2291710 RepID=UPI0031BFDB41|nr:hypothetical protein [Dokdonella sp.]
MRGILPTRRPSPTTPRSPRATGSKIEENKKALDKTHPKKTDEEDSIFKPANLRGFQIGGDTGR